MGSSSPIFRDENFKKYLKPAPRSNHIHELFETLATAMDTKLVYPTKTSMYLSHLKKTSRGLFSSRDIMGDTVKKTAKLGDCGVTSAMSNLHQLTIYKEKTKNNSKNMSDFKNPVFVPFAILSDFKMRFFGLVESHSESSCENM